MIGPKSAMISSPSGEVTSLKSIQAAEIAWDVLIDLARNGDPETRLDASERIIRLAGEIKPSVAQYLMSEAFKARSDS